MTLGPVSLAPSARDSIAEEVVAMTTCQLLATPGVALTAASWSRQAQLPFAVRLDSPGERVTVVTLKGEVDIHTASHFRDVITATISQGARAIVIDLTEVAFIDASGLGVVVVAARSLGPGAVALVLPHVSLIRVFRICGLDRLLEIYETRDEALRGLVRSP